MPSQPVDITMGGDDLGAISLCAAFELYRLNIIVFRSQSRSTERHHLDALHSLVKFLGNDIGLTDLRFEQVRDWKQSMEDKGNSIQTIRGYLIKLRVVLNYMRLCGCACLDPTALPLPRRSQQVPGVLTPEEVKRLISASGSYDHVAKVIKARNQAIISLLYSTGLRVNELCSLNLSDVTEDHFPLIGKGGKSRLCFIDKRSRALLINYLSLRADNEAALFISNLNKRRITPGNVQEIFKNARRAAGFDWNVHPHSLRHSFATNLMKNGAHIYGISKLMGHASLDTTAIYLHLFDPELQEIHTKYHST
jgi:integrase/recombinase XerD